MHCDDASATIDAIERDQPATWTRSSSSIYFGNVGAERLTTTNNEISNLGSIITTIVDRGATKDISQNVNDFCNLV